MIRDYTLALERDPEFIDAYVNRGQAWQAQRDYAPAIADYNLALQLKPDAGVY